MEMILPQEKNKDNRLFDRFPARFPAKIKDSRETFGANITLRDACAQGAKILSRERFFINDSVSLEVLLPDNKSPMSLHGQVVWTKQVDPSLWDIGLKFHRIDLLRLSRLFESSVSSRT